jgi:hypothetical protein
MSNCKLLIQIGQNAPDNYHGKRTKVLNHRSPENYGWGFRFDSFVFYAIVLFFQEEMPPCIAQFDKAAFHMIHLPVIPTR